MRQLLQLHHHQSLVPQPAPPPAQLLTVLRLANATLGRDMFMGYLIIQPILQNALATHSTERHIQSLECYHIVVVQRFKRQ